MLSKLKMESCNARSDPSTRLSRLPLPPANEKESEFPYREAIGSIMFAMICTRPDIAYAVGQVAQFSSAPSHRHWEAVKRIFSYLKGTASHGVSYGWESSGQLAAYSDADFAGNVDDRRSTSGCVLLLNGGQVAWGSRRQRCTALSTTEAEYVSASAAARDVVWFRHLLEEVGARQTGPTPLWCDNESAIRLVKNPEHHHRTKHIDVKFHHIRGLQEEGVILVAHVRTDDQLADVFTKGLEAGRFRHLVYSIGVIDSI